MSAVRHHRLVARGIFLLVSLMVLPSKAHVKTRLPIQAKIPVTPMLPQCRAGVLGDCLLPGPRPMSWDSGQRFCREKNGFLLEEKELDQLRDIWTSRVQTPLERNLTMPVSVLSWPAINTTWPGKDMASEDLTWSALAPHAGHYQWLSRLPWNGVFTKWQGRPPTTARDCVSFNLTSGKFMTMYCGTELRFFCILHGGSELPDITANDVELRVTSSAKIDHGWIEVSEPDLKRLSLDCDVYSVKTKQRLTQYLPVFWSKDDIYVHQHGRKIFPVSVQDSTKSLILHWNSMLNDSAPIHQGTFWCEAWLPGSAERIISNKVLVTLESWMVLIVSADRMETSPVSEKNAILNIKNLLRPHLRGIDRFIVDPISIDQENDSSSSISKYRFQVHLPRTLLLTVLRLFNGNNISLKYYFARFGYKNTSSATLATYCLEHKTKVGRDGQVVWPFTKAGNTRPRNMRCEVGDQLIPGICRWNYTHGAHLEFNASRCERFDFCPRGYYHISRDLCASFTTPSDWEHGFSELYKTGHEISILDSSKFHVMRKQDTSSIYNQTKKIIQETNGHSILWLPVKRIVPRGPLTFLGPGVSEYPYGQYKGSPNFNITWAKGHPDNNYECLALNIQTDELLTQSCDTENSFVAIVNVSSLHQIPKDTVNELLTEDPACPEEWTTSDWQGENLVCFKLFVNVGNYTHGEAKSFCENEDAELPSAGAEFLDWAYRQYLYNNDVDEVWMTTEKPSWFPEDGGSLIDVVNWLPNTNYSMRQAVLTPHGWKRDEEESKKSSILCQKKGVERTGLSINLHKGQNKFVCINQEQLGNGSHSLRCFKNGKEINVFTPNSDCRHSIIAAGQGYYQCQKWATLPFQLKKSNTFLHREAKSLTFAVRLSEVNTYIPEIHDSTFRFAGTHFFDACSKGLIEKFNELYESQGFATMKTFIENYSYSPGRKKNGIMYRFHFNLQFTNEREREEEIFQIFNSLLERSALSQDCVLESVRSTTKCFSETTVDSLAGVKNLTWPDTNGADVVLPRELCITEDGEPITRECIGNFLEGYHWGSPSGSCVGSPTNKTKKLWQINNNASVTQTDIPTTLSNLTQDGNSLQPVDIHFVATSMRSLSEEKETLSEIDLEKIVETMNNVMEAKDETFEPVQNALSSSSILFNAFEEMTFKVQLPEKVGDQKVNASKSLITVERLDLEANSTIIGFQSKDGGRIETTIEKGVKTDHIDPDAAIILPNNLTYTVATSHTGRRARMRSDNKIQLTFAVFKNSKLFQDRKSYPNFTVSSPIIQATYKDTVVKDLKEPVTLIFKTHNRYKNKTKCVYWDPKKNSRRGGWSTQGCWKGKSTDKHEVCYCNHLTCFAQLINYDDDDNYGDHAFVLDLITIVGCCLSIVGFLLVFTTFFLFKKWRRSLDNKILVNLSFSVFCSIVIFLAGINQTWNKILCRSIAVALHYFILASFGWMLVEAVHQYLKFVKVVGTYIPRFMWKASVTAWGMPVIPIIAVLVCDSTLYDNGDDLYPESKICWMSSDGFLYAFLPPLLLTMTINVIMYSLILYGAVCGRARVNSTMSERSLFISQLRMAICVFILLGFTWIFGILAIWKGKILFSYLFCIFNTLQGFFIFIFHVYRGRSARRLWGDFLSVITKSPTSTEPSNSNNAHVSLNYRGQLDSVTYNHGGGILVIPQKFSVHPSTRGMSIKSLGTTTTLIHSRTSFSP